MSVSLESYRAWESGRRPLRPGLLIEANVLTLQTRPDTPVSLHTLANLISVHVRTLHAAAKDGRLRVTYDTRTTFHRVRVRSTPVDVQIFRHTYFDRSRWPTVRPPTMTWQEIPKDYASQIRTIRRQMGLSLGQFAVLIGAANKAVVYQWESQKRCPSPVFWCRIQTTVGERENHKDFAIKTASGTAAFGSTVNPQRS